MRDTKCLEYTGTTVDNVLLDRGNFKRSALQTQHGKAQIC